MRISEFSGEKGYGIGGKIGVQTGSVIKASEGSRARQRNKQYSHDLKQKGSLFLVLLTLSDNHAPGSRSCSSGSSSSSKQQQQIKARLNRV